MTSNIKVLHVIGALYQGGTEQQLENFLTHTKAKNIEHKIVTFYGDGDVGKRIAKKWPVINLHPNIQPKTINLQTIGAMIDSLFALKKIIKSYKPDIIHSHLPYANVISRLAKGSHPCTHISAIRVKEVQRSFDNQLDQLTRSKTDLYTVNSKQIQKHLMNQGIPKSKIRVIYNGLIPPKKGSLKLPFSTKNKHIVIMVANFRKQKDHHTLLKAIQHIKSRTPHILCLLAGHGTEEQHIQEEIDRMELSEEVKLIGTTPYIGELHKLAAVNVLSTHYEGTPNAVIEGMFLKTPTIASDIPEIREVMTPKEGYLFAPGDYKQLGRFVMAILETSQQKIIQAAYTKAKQLFDNEQMVQSYEDLYKIRKKE